MPDAAPRSEPTVESPAPPARLLEFLAAHGLEPAFLDPGAPMPSVESAAAAIGVPPEQILKTLVFASADGRTVVAVASGLGRVDRRRLAAAAGLGKLALASPETVLRVTGYPAGGVCPVGHREAVPVVVDRAAAALPVAYGGGGDERLLLRIAPEAIVRLNRATVADIVRPPE